jgi:monovalent cation:H+ antiporter-2, CPA2 family
MHDEQVLIATLAIGLTAAFLGGLIARRVGLPAIVGYLIAGIAVGPFTQGVVADTATAAELAEIGVILLMFGVGIHFSIRDLMAVRTIALPGAVIQITVATVLGLLLGLALGWGVGGGLVLGLAVSVASTVVLLRALEDRDALTSTDGRIAVGWLIVEDLFTVVVLVVLPSIAPLLGGAGDPEAASHPLVTVAIALVKTALFAGLMLVLGARVIPWLLDYVIRDGSRELFTVAVLATAVGIAYVAAELFDLSFALGAFLAGLVVGESDHSHRAAEETLPLRDAFAVLFFVSVGMLFDPSYLLRAPAAILAVVLIVVVGKSIAAFGIVALFKYPARTGLTVAAGLAQVGEFSFLLATVGLSLALLPVDGVQLIVAASIISITINPFLFKAIDPLTERFGRREPAAAPDSAA